LLAAGLVHPVFTVLLQRRSVQEGHFSAREGFLLGGIAAGLFTAGISVTFVLINLTNGALSAGSGLLSRLGTAINKFWNILFGPDPKGQCPNPTLCPPSPSFLDAQTIALLVVVVVGAFIAVVYYWHARAEHLLPTSSPMSDSAGAKKQSPLAINTKISAILSELMAGRVSHEQAVSQCRVLIEGIERQHGR
jgi:hypothetical protein